MYDYHTHTGYSYDNISVSMEDMVIQAALLGLDEIAITDHYDPFFPSEPAELDFPNYFAEIAALKEKYVGTIRIVSGLELGLMPGEALQKCAEAVQNNPCDFVIASIHSTAGFSIHTSEFLESRTFNKAAADYYNDMLFCIREFDDFDVLGHINAIERYISDTPPDAENAETIDEILKTLVRKNKGLEINTSFYRNGSKRPTPTPEILKRYVELGGKIITTGSDAHSPIYIGDHLADAENMIRSVGLKKLATFKNRELFPINI